MADLLSVVIPTYNRASLLPRAISSVLVDTVSPIEVIVVDDGSEDDTPAVVAALSDTRVTYIEVSHGGVSAARNAGAADAAGRWLAFLDSDDEVLPGWASAMLEAVTRSGGVALCGGEAVDEEGHVLWTWSPPVVEGPVPQQVAEMFLPGMFIIDRQLFLDAGGYVERLAFGENTELALRLIFLREVPIRSEPRVLVRRHVAATRKDYTTARISSARFVLEHHHWTRRTLPALWASYNALVGTEAARQKHWREAKRHFMRAAAARRSIQHLGRLAVSFLPFIRNRAWPSDRKTAS